jgi:hypothetical protein
LPGIFFDSLNIARSKLEVTSLSTSDRLGLKDRLKTKTKTREIDEYNTTQRNRGHRNEEEIPSMQNKLNTKQDSEIRTMQLWAKHGPELL